MSRILVADDNSNIQKMVALALKDEGIDVVAVGNGDAAMRKIPDLRPDLVLADIFMPVRNGYEVCEFVKNDSRYMNTPVVLLVGAFDPLDEDETQRVRADGVLKKPFVPPDPLINMVKALLAKSNGQNAAAVAAATPAPPAFEPQAKAAIPQAPPVREAVAPPRVSPEQIEKPKPVTAAPSYVAEAAASDEAEEVTTAVRDPNLGEPFWAAPEEPEADAQAERESGTQPEEMLDMHSFGKDEERSDTGRFRPDSTMFENAGPDDAPAEKKKKTREVPKVEAVEIASASSKRVEADVTAGKPVEAASEETAQAPAAEEIPVEPFQFDPALTFSASTETAEEPQESMPLPELLPVPNEPAPAEEAHAIHLEPAPLEAPLSEHAATLSWPTLDDPIEAIPAATAIPAAAIPALAIPVPAAPVEAHASFEPAEMSLTPLPDQETVIRAATEAARTAFSELKTFAGVIPPIEDAGVATQELASHPAGHAVNGQAAEDTLQDGSAGLGHTEAPKATPEMIDAVVNKLLERMQPQIMEVVNREVLRPAIEAIVRREIEKN